MRSVKIDILRGIAVIGMIAAHSLFFFHDGSNSALGFIAKTLNTTVFTIFIFVFGQSLSKWLDEHSHEHFQALLLISLKRSFIFYCAYAGLAIAALATVKSDISDIIAALVLAAPPSFTEYMPLLIILAFVTPFLRPLFRFTRSSILLTFLMGAFSYLVGVTLHELDVPNILLPLKLLLAGDGTALRFPVLFYFPVMLWGLWWQHDVDHNTQNKVNTGKHIWMIGGVVITTVVGVVVIRLMNVPLLDPAIRWPPSVTFLTTGMSIAAIGLFLMPSFAWVGTQYRRVFAYFGRDALDLWVSHLLLLFVYRKFISIHFDNPLIVLALTVVLMICSVAISSITLTNNIRFPFGITFTGTKRFRKRYAIYALLGLVAILLSVNAPSSPYGNFLNAPALTIGQKLPVSTTAKLTSDSKWYVKQHYSESVELIIAVEDGGKSQSVNPDLVKIYINSKESNFSAIKASDNSLHFTKPVSDMLPGTYNVEAKIHNGDAEITSNAITINISEPLMVAWTFDWEGWDAPERALTRMTDLSIQYPSLKFSHFVNPRMFLPGIVTDERKEELITFLNVRFQKKDELAMHVHMQYDFVSAAGVTPRSTSHWGLLSEEGYDVPTTEYTPEEFRTMIQYAKKLATESGLPEMKGFRAGGWYLDTAQLNELQTLGYSYDSSGRDKPVTGAFRNTPWKLAIGAQPYFPSAANQNIVATDQNTILEIPSNGLSTYELDTNMLAARIKAVYTGGVLTKPKTVVFVSHPQFYTREFSKISPILRQISAISQVANAGPAVFATTGEISSLWHSLYK